MGLRRPFTPPRLLPAKISVPPEIEYMIYERKMKEVTEGYKASDLLWRICNISAMRLDMDDIFRAPDGYIVSSWDIASITKHFILNEDPQSTKPCGDGIIERAWLLEINRPEPRIDKEISSNDWWLHFVRAGFITIKYRKRINSLLGRGVLLFGESEMLGTDAEQMALRHQIETILGMRIEEFLRIIFGLFTLQLKNKGIIKMEHILGSKDPNMQEIMLPEKVERVLEILSVTPKQFRSIAAADAPSGLEAYILNPLFTYPIIREEQGDQLFIPVTSLLIQRATTGLYHLVLGELGAKSKNDTRQFREAFGKHVFEPYIARHLTEIIPIEQQRNGFKYFDPRSPSKQLGEVDLIGWDDHGILFVETTLATASLEIQLAANREDVMKYVKKLTAKVRQLHGHHQHQLQIKREIDPALETLPYHCILVTFQQLPMPNLLMRYLMELELKETLGDDFVYHICTMEDWEHLCSSSKKFGVSISNLLTRKAGQIPTGYSLLRRDCLLDSVFAKIELNMPDPQKKQAGKDPPKWDITDTIYSDFTDFLLKHFGKESIGSQLLDDAQNRMWLEMGIDLIEEHRKSKTMSGQH